MHKLRCSFCGKERKDVKKLIVKDDNTTSNDQLTICDECLDLCSEIIEDKTKTDLDLPLKKMMPKNIKKFLDEYVIGQEFAKIAMSVAIYNHYKRLENAERLSEHNKDAVELTKGNILMIGPTGCGKTLIAETLAKYLDVPFSVSDATTLTEAGYVGEDVENIVKNLWIAADRNIERTQKGIICIDEIDKIATKSTGPGAGRDVGGEGVQQALLKVIESGKVSITPDSMRGRPQQELIQIDTTNILFICTGSFSEIADIVQKRISSSTMGFTSEIPTKTETSNALMKQIEAEDLMKFGLIPEFIGRIPIIVVLDDLDEDSMLKILWKPSNSLLNQYEQLFSLEKVKLSITKKAMAAIVKLAMQRKSGARALRAVMEEVMLDIMYEIPSMKNVKEVKIDEKVVLEKAQPKIIFNTSPQEETK